MTILFAYDGSQEADGAIAAAKELLGHDDADAVVVTVWEPLTVQAVRALSFGGPVAMPLDVAKEDAEAEAEARELADHGAQLARDAGFAARAQAITDRENIAETVVATAEELDADLIVLGARGLAGVRAFLGSVSNHVLQHSKRPVLVVPGPTDA